MNNILKTLNFDTFLSYISMYFNEHRFADIIYSKFLNFGTISKCSQIIAERDQIASEADIDILFHDKSMHKGHVLVEAKNKKSGKIVWLSYPCQNLGKEKDLIAFKVKHLIIEQDANSPHRYHKVPEEGVVIDIGCSEGIFPAMACAKASKIIGIDIDSSFEKAFAETCMLNGIEGKDVEFLNMPVGLNSSFDFRQLLKEGQKLAAIKMDIEGYELEALIKLKNIIIEHKPMLQICSYHRSADFKDILEYLVNTLNYENFTFNKNHIIFSLDGVYECEENFLRQGLIIANY